MILGSTCAHSLMRLNEHNAFLQITERMKYDGRLKGVDFSNSFEPLFVIGNQFVLWKGRFQCRPILAWNDKC